MAEKPKGEETAPEGVKPTVRKAKVAVVDPNDNIFMLIRSQAEDSRRGGLDLPGGSEDMRGPGEPRETPLETMLRETGEEAAGLRLANIVHIYKHTKTKATETVETHLFAATGEFPDDDPDNVRLSFEHSGQLLVPRLVIPFLGKEALPPKYQAGIEAGASVFESLVQLQLDGGEGMHGAELALHLVPDIPDDMESEAVLLGQA